MRVLIHRRISLAGTIGLLTAVTVLLPLRADPFNPIASAWAGGERGGIGDQVKGNEGYTDYLAKEDPVTPCQSCYGGGGTDAQNLSTFTPGQAKLCESCVNGSWGR